MVSTHSVCRNAWMCKEGECTLCWVGAFPSFPAQLCSSNATWKVVDSVKGRKLTDGTVDTMQSSESLKDNARTNRLVCRVCLLGQVHSSLGSRTGLIMMIGCTTDKITWTCTKSDPTTTQPLRLFISFAIICNYHDVEFQKLMVGSRQGVVREGTYTVKELAGIGHESGHVVLITPRASTEYYDVLWPSIT